MKQLICAILGLIWTTTLIAQSAISDADGDTKIQTEATTDDDTIRFILHGTEHIQMSGPQINVVNTGRSVFFGAGAGASDDLSDNQNTAIGDDAMASTTSGEQNVAIGESSLLENMSGQKNTAVGQFAMRRMKGSHNVAVGEEALYGDGAINSNNNTAVGRRAGFNAAGDSCVFLGSDAGRNESSSNKLYIDNSATSAPLIYGEFDNDLIIINGICEVTSDMRLKSDIVKVEGALEKVMGIAGYKYKRMSVADPDKREIGVLAQEVIKVVPEVVGQNREGMLSVNYSGLIPVLIEAIKEQQAAIDKLKHKVSMLER